MKLLFLYVDEYHCLKNAQMNFAEYPRFEYKNGEICESEESKNYKFESVSLFKPPVDNISAIVGSNGSGKTSILKIFEEIFVSNDGIFYNKTKYILVYQIEKDFYLLTNIKKFLEQEELRISERIEIKVIRPSEHYFADKFFDTWYLSNIFSFNNGDSFNDTIICGNNQFVNLSLRNLITSKWGIDLFENKTTGVKYDLEISQYDFATIKEFNCCIDFLLSYPENIDLNITIPTDICFYVNWNDKGYFLSEEENDDILRKIRDKIKKEEADILNGLEKKHNSSKRNYKDFYKIILFSLFYNYCRVHLFLDKYDDLNREIDIKQRNSLRKIFETENSLFVNDISREIKIQRRDFLEKEFSSGNSSIVNIENFFKKLSEEDIYVKYNNENVRFNNNNEKSIYEFINYLKGIDDRFFGNMCLKFNISNDSSFIKNFYEKYMRARSITDFLIYNFEPGPSAGEELIISTFARLFEKINDKHDKHKKKENIIMMLDEVDVSFHPRLQQHLIELLVKFLETIAPEYKIQLLITTHSPIILSDLPKSNVIFLQKEVGEHIAKILDSNSLNNTFGANIMQLYKDSFFLKDGFIGSFAKSKIEQLIAEIRKINNGEIESKHLSSNSECTCSNRYWTLQAPNRNHPCEGICEIKPFMQD